MNSKEYFSIKFENDELIFLDQTKLPNEEIYFKTKSYKRVAKAIEKLEIRGAPLIGIAAAYGLALSIKKSSDQNIFLKAYERLKNTRPTAVNLFYALNTIKLSFENANAKNDLYKVILNKAIELHNNDKNKCDLIGKNGLSIFHKKSTVLTHCNTGKFATGGDGTAFNVIKQAYKNNLVDFVYADETRPLLQGSRLTSYELEKEKIPFAILTDSSAASLFSSDNIDLVIVGADRIAANGDTANKIGTYNLAVLCHYHKKPFYIVAPSTTIDSKLSSGDKIEIEYRNGKELFEINGRKFINKNLKTYTPAFDVTPSKLIKGIITEKKIYEYPYNFINE
ncbi:MAG: S-methyl-5-thioribose-1-phosphate isomerase [Ignavibacteriales bacterium CG_4_9_14_3_um_filter_30_11]|nr:MAG: S-methyl-5-thioribose-1-phosphate isomerase [Ignavibacteriales bacterium CG_4_9_14_3_um_filter_30_11]